LGIGIGWNPVIALMSNKELNLLEARKAIRGLLQETNPFDAQAVYYANFHPDQKVKIRVFPSGAISAAGYICLARTGMDLFRPFLTMRLPRQPDTGNIDLNASSQLIYSSLHPGSDVIGTGPIEYLALMEALFDVDSKAQLKLFVLDPKRFKPIVNVLVTHTESYNGLPRFTIRKGSGEGSEVLASAGLNWQSSRFAEIYTHTSAPHRRQGYGKSVVAAAVQHVLEHGRRPLYMVNQDNEPSIRLARSVGFVDTGAMKFQMEGVLRQQQNRL
jgi:RimJ/RimL family protein N-acetyltransferase